jgi:c-di-GMP phosphodiesterase
VFFRKGGFAVPVRKEFRQPSTLLSYLLPCPAVNCSFIYRENVRYYTHMDVNETFIGRQPILDRDQRIFGYELLFRSGPVSTADVTDDVRATASVMVNTLSNMGVRKLIGEKKGFINVDEGLLRSGILDLLPKESMVLEILETVNLTGDVVDMLRKMRREGYHFALDDFIYSDSALPVFNLVDYIKVDILLSDRQAREHLKRVLASHRVQLLGEKVETREDFEDLRHMGFSLFQGYFFARPSVITGKSISPTLMVLMELLRMLSQEAELPAIEQLFRRNPELNIKLLQFMNSATFYTSQKVTSLKQSIALLGYRKLQKWVTLLLFAGADDDMKTNPLLERAAIRGRVSELLAERIRDDRTTADSAFIAGVLSLADALFQMPMAEILTELNMSGDIRDGLVHKGGFLGALILMVEGLEKEDPSGVAELLGQYGLALEDLFSMEKRAIVEYENYNGG